MNNLEQEIQKFYENYQGANDFRSAVEKAKDFNQSEFVASANVVDWKEKVDTEWRNFPVLNQFYTSKCVAFTTAKLALINYWLKTKEFLLFSPNSIYDYRSNKPSGGMVGNDAFDIWHNNGISLEAVCKSNQVQETDPIVISTFALEVAKGFKLGQYITINNGDFDTVASTIQTTSKGVMCWFWFTSAEWSPEIPVANPNTTYDNSAKHSVTVTDCGLRNGIQYLRIEDSAHFGNIAVRYITREFFNARNFLTKYPMNFNYEDPIVPPPVTFVFNLDMKFGDNNNDVLELQKHLQKLGFFPSNITPTTYFGNITKTAVIAFQKEKGLLADGLVGPATRAELNK